MTDEPSAVEDAVELGRSGSRAARPGVVVAAALALGAVGGYLVGGWTAGPDASQDGQVGYACALAAQIREGHPTEADWGPVDEDPAYAAVSAIPHLLGVTMPRRAGQGGGFADLGWTDLWQQPDGPDLDDLLDATIEECAKR